MRVFLALLATAAVSVVMLGGVGLYIALNLQDYRHEVERTVARLLQKPVEIGAVSVTWDGYIPVVQVRDLRLTDTGAQSFAGFKHAALRIDVWNSLTLAELRPSAVQVVGAKLGIYRDAAGSVRIVGLGGSTHAKAGSGLQSARRLLLGPTRLELRDAQLVINDARRGFKPIPLALELTIQRRGGTQNLQGFIRLPDDRVGAVRVDGQLGISPKGSGWVADLRVIGDGVALSPVARVMPGSRLPGSDSRADFDVLVRFKDGQLVQSSGRTSLSGLALLPGDPLGGPTSLSANFAYNPVQTGWRLDVFDLSAKGSLDDWTAKKGSIRYRLGKDGQPGRYTANLSQARIEDVLAMMAYLEPTSEDVIDLRAYLARGDVTELSAAWLNVDHDDVPFATAFTFKNLGWPERKDESWGVTGLAGFASITPDGGVVNLATGTPVRIDAAPISAKPLLFREIDGTIDLRHRGEVLTLFSEALTLKHDAYALTLSGKIVSDEDPSLKLDVNVALPQLSVAQLRSMLPSPVFSSGLNSWLSRAATDGVIQDLRLDLSGRVRDLGANSPAAAVAVNADLRKVQLNYAPGWPELQQLSGPIKLEGGKLIARAKSARVSKTKVDIGLTVENVNDADSPVSVSFKSAGLVEDIIGILRRSPLAKRMPPALAELKANGRAVVKSRIDIRSGSSPPTVDTTVQLRNVTLKPTPTLPALEALTGDLRIKGTTLSASKLVGRWLKQAVELDLEVSEQHRARLSLKTGVDRGTLQRIADAAGVARPDWLSRIKGKSRWAVEIRSEKPDEYSFKAFSDLASTSIAVPAPLGKPAKRGRPLEVTGSVNAQAVRVSARYGPIHVRGLVPYPEPRQAGYRVRLNGDAKPARRGDRQISGQLSLLDLDAWSAFLDPDTEATRAAIPSIDVDLLSLRFAGISFPQTKVRMPRPLDDKPIEVQIEGPKLAGRVFPPDTKQTLRIDLDRLVVPELEGNQNIRTDPRTMPSFTFLVKQLVYDDVDLGTLKLSASKAPSGLEFDTIYLISPLFDLNGSGHWHENTGKQNTQLKLKIHANALRNLMLAAGVKKKVTEGGATQVQANLSWPGTPGDVSFASLTGEVAFQSGAGRILAVDAGTGARLFGLLNLRSLPQILSLDFGGFLDEGLGYERISGTFTLDDGNAYTNNLRLATKTADINVAGRTGLVQEDYDQLVNVTPRLSDSLPVAGAAFGGVGAGVGAALWLAEKILNTKLLDKVASFNYQVSGAWDNPKISRLDQQDDQKVDR